MKIIPQELDSLVMSQLEMEFRKIADNCIEKAVEDYRQALRGQIGHMVLRMLNQYSLQRDGTDLIIRVKNEF